jgi:NitT/TauT family transport system permease protein
MRRSTAVTARERSALGAGFVVLLIAAWQLAVGTHVVSSPYLPSPSAIWAAAAHLAADGRLGGDILHTVLACLGGWAAGSAVGFALGLLLGVSRLAWTWTMASFEVLRAVPAIMLVPAAVLVFGFSLQTELAVIAFASVWPVLINMIDGVGSVTPAQADLARVLRLSRRRRLTKLILPASVPYLLVALQISLSTALALAIVAEIVGNPQGVGYALVTAQQQIQPGAVFAYVVATGALGALLNWALSQTVRRLAPGSAALLERNVAR